MSGNGPGAPVAAPLRGVSVVVTGATGQVAEPLAVSLARDNTVVAAARFKDAAARARLEAGGVRCVSVDLGSGDVEALPADADYVLHFAVAKTNDWSVDLETNCTAVAALMEHHRDARGFLHCSSTAVYKPSGHEVFTEDGLLGDNHGVWPFLRTYSICKIAAEGTARWAARRFELPTTIARLSVPYGDRGGWPAIHLEMMRNGSAVPVHVNAPSVYHQLHEEDILATVPGLLAAAATPATVVNWGGERASIEEWCSFLAELCGLSPTFEPTDQTIDSVELDLSRLHELEGPTRGPWSDGMRSMVEARHPELMST